MIKHVNFGKNAKGEVIIKRKALVFYQVVNKNEIYALKEENKYRTLFHNAINAVIKFRGTYYYLQNSIPQVVAQAEKLTLENLDKYINEFHEE